MKKLIIFIILFLIILLLPVLNAAPRRIIAIGPGALRFVAYLGAVDKLCGIERIEFKLKRGLIRPYYKAVEKRIKKLPIIGEGGPGKLPYFEEIIKIHPDLIIAVGYTKSQINLICEKTQIPVLLLSYGNLGVLNKKFFTSLKLLGEKLNKEKRANELINFINLIKNDLLKRVKKIKTTKTVYVGGIAYKGIHDITSTDTDFYPFKLLKLKNVASFSKLKGHIFINWENLLKWNPDYIFIDKTSLPLIISDYKEYPFKYKLLKAFNQHHVFILLPYNYYNTNVSLALISSYCIGKKVYPEYFKDINLKKTAEKILYEFFKIKFNIPENFCNQKFNGG